MIVRVGHITDIRREHAIVMEVMHRQQCDDGAMEMMQELHSGVQNM